MGGSKGGDTVTSASPVPLWAEAISKEVLNAGTDLGFGRDPFDVWSQSERAQDRFGQAGIEYGPDVRGHRIVEFDPYQQAAHAAAENTYLRGDPYLGEATGLGRQAQESIRGLSVLDPGYHARGFSANYDPRSFESGYGPSPFSTNYVPGSFESSYGPSSFETNYGASEFDFGNLRGGGQGGTGTGGPGEGGSVLQDYMSPYIQDVVDFEKRAASEAFEQQENRSDAERVASGARGGYREALEQATSRAEQAEVLSGIEAKGRQSALKDAQGQFERDRAAGIQAAQMGDMSAYRAAQERLKAQALGDESAFRGSQQTLTAQQASDQARYRAAQEDLRTQTLGDESSFRASQEALRAAGMEDESYRQFANFRGRADMAEDASAARQAQMRYDAQAQDMQNLIAQSQQLGRLAQFSDTLGGSAQDREFGRIQALQRAGAERHDMSQSLRDLTEERARSLYGAPFERLNWMQGLLSGVAQQANSYTRSPAPGFLRQGVGAAAGLAGVQNLFDRS
jgi:hypothetical protein